MKRLFLLIAIIISYSTRVAIAQNLEVDQTTANFELKGISLGMHRSDVPIKIVDCGLWWNKTQETYCRWAEGTTFGGYQVWHRERRKDDILFDRNGKVVQVKFRLQGILDDNIEQALLKKYGACNPPKISLGDGSQWLGCRNGNWNNGIGEIIEYEIYTKGTTVMLHYDDNYSPQAIKSKKITNTKSDI